MAEERIQRRLAAILAADMVGYSRLMGADEEGTIARQKVHRAELIDPEIANHGGRIVKTMGDGLLVEFASVVDAVNCAVKVQQAMSDREGDTPQDRRIQYRVGINLGDIVIDGDDILGDGVNVAARLEGIADPGGICVSGKVFEEVGTKVNLRFEDLGPQQVKNIATPVRAYRVLPDGGSQVQETEPTPLREKLSIAVLPFDNLSNDPEQEYFADGIAEDIITALSRYHWFFVIARNSSFSYKGTSPDVRRVAEELGVQYVLEGSVRKSGNRVRISAQLIDALTGSHVWAERYDRDLEDIFAVQDEITEAISGTVAPSFFQAEARRAERKTPENLDAWDYTMRGHWHLWRMGKDDIVEARRLFKAACELDPTSATAYAGLAFAWALEVYYRPTDDPKTARDSAFQAAQTAVALDSSDAWAQAVLGIVYAFLRRLDDCVSACRRALDLNPSLAFAEGVLSIGLAFRGEYDEAMEHAARAELLSPRDPQQFLWHQARAHAALGVANYEDAAMWGKKSTEAYPDFGGGWRILAASYGHLGRVEEAAAAVQELRRIYPKVTIESMRASHLSNQPEHIERYLDGLRKAGLPDEVDVGDEPKQRLDKPSIAVLPFDNLSNDPDQEYFSDGMAEDLITDLSKISSLSVAARNSSFSFKGQMPDIKEVAEKLGVAFVLEGSVRKMGDRLRINAQLINAADGRHLWAERYDGNMTEIFDFQDRIRGEIVEALEVQLTPTDEARTKSKPTDNVKAYDLFLKGRSNFHIFSPGNFYEAIEYLEEAIEIDPDFADAHTLLAQCNFVGWVHMRPGFDDGLNLSNELAEKAVALDGTSALALVTLAFDQTVLSRHEPATASLEKAITLAANNADVYAISGQVLNYLGDPERGLKMLEKAFSLEVFAPPLWDFYEGVSQLLLRRYDDALIIFNRAIAKIPKFMPAYAHLAWLYVELGRLDDAQTAIEKVLELTPKFTIKKAAARWHYRLDEHIGRMRDALQEAGLPEGNAVEDEPPPLPDKPSIAVLAFDNLSGDPEQEYFADGIAEDIITGLSRFHWFFVIARNSSFTYKGRAVDVKQVARELGVQYVLEGSVRKGGNRVRITAQLIDALTGRHIWADRYDRELDDIFAVQDEISEAITTTVAPAFTSAEAQRAERKPPENLDAWDYCMRGNWYLSRGGKGDIAKAQQLFESALGKDPKNSMALSGLAITLCFVLTFGWANDTSETLSSAYEAARRAVGLDENDGWAHVALGWCNFYRHQLDAAAADCRQALKLNPNLAVAEAWLAITLSWQGKNDEAIRHAKEATRLSPRDTQFFVSLAPATAEFGAGEYENAVEAARKTTEVVPDFPGGWRHLAASLAHVGRLEEAREAKDQLLQINPNERLENIRATMPSVHPKRLEQIVEGLRKAGLPD